MKRAYSLACFLGAVHGGIFGQKLGGFAGMLVGLVGCAVCGAIGVFISRFIYRAWRQDMVLGLSFGLIMAALIGTIGFTATVNPVAAAFSVGDLAVTGGVVTYKCR